MMCQCRSIDCHKYDSDAGAGPGPSYGCGGGGGVYGNSLLSVSLCSEPKIDLKKQSIKKHPWGRGEKPKC